jgi:predicted MPP superfamily phosphohydrolase
LRLQLWPDFLPALSDIHLMVSRFLFALLAVAVVLLLDWYVFQAVRTVSQGLSPSARKIVYYLFWGLTVVTCATIIIATATRGTPPGPFRTYLAAALLIIFVSKLFVVLFLVLDDIIRLIKWITSQLFRGPEREAIGVKITRSEFLNKMALVAGAIPFSAFIYGMVRGAYDYHVRKVTLRLPNLPAAFDGYKMLQISDLHTGSFHTSEPLEKAVALINKQGADVIFFTGDLVNNVATEVLPHVPALGKLSAPDGVLSVLGNHDYGDYVSWETPEQKRANLQRLVQAHGEMGWQILLNKAKTIKRGAEEIAIMGIENWSAVGHFPKYGKLAEAHEQSGTAPFKVLLSHDPSHWLAEVVPNFKDIDLMLAGHTHGMQFGVRIPGFQWSPVQYVYKQWAGLYKQGKQHLYVNTGLGFLGYPGRVGIRPEITVFELKRG